MTLTVYCNDNSATSQNVLDVCGQQHAENSKKTFLEWDNYFYANYDLSEYSDKEEKVKLMTEIYLRKVSLRQRRVFTELKIQ